MATPPFEVDPAQRMIGQAVASFLAGDPLRCIAEAADMSSWETLRLLGTRIADRGEEQRSKALRNRCSATAAALFQERQRFEQLHGAGIDLVDIPKVLAALGAPLDVDIAVEMLRSLQIFKELLHLALAQERGEATWTAPPLDTLSLLYILGRHRGVRPDYELALEKMSLSSIAETRQLLGPGRTPRQTAEVLAVIETTAQTIRAGEVEGISYSDYDKMARMISELHGNLTSNPGIDWPVPADELRRRLGKGFWDAALSSVGLQLRTPKGRFTAVDFVEAARGFNDDYEYFGSPKDVASYDSWTIAETAAGRDRPSVVAIRRHFGAWESVIGAVMPAEIEGEYDGIVNHLRAESLVEEAWARAGELISEILANMPWNSFLSVQYLDEAGGLAPYAQASPSADGVWFEVVSEQYLPAEMWPLDAGYLTENGWFAPDNDFPNWYKGGIPHLEAGHQILEGLRFGRHCQDAGKLQWHTGEFPGGPGPDGGVTVDDALAGAVQTLHNAA